MTIIKYPQKIDLKNYDKSNLNTKSFFGLSKEIIFCKKCAMSNQKPISSVEFKSNSKSVKKGIYIASDGICDPCKVNEEKKLVNWSDREKQLIDLCNKYRKKDGSYDCIVPGSGGKDSVYASHILKTKYNMNPLTVTWAPNIYTDWGWKNFNSWINSGSDNFLVTPNGKVRRLLTRLALEKLLHPFQPFMLGQRNMPAKIAMQMNIKLVLYGENEAEYNNPKKEFGDPKRKLSIWSIKSDEEKDLKISGFKLNELEENFGISKNELSLYLPPKEESVLEKEIDLQYLGYYLKWDQQGKYYYAVENSGFIPSPMRTSGTYSKYNSIDDKMDDFHFYTTLIKFGIGRVNYDVSQEIRNGDITYDEGKMLVKKYLYEYPKRFEDILFNYFSFSKKDFPLIDKFFDQPTMNKSYFDELINSFRSPHLWYHDNGEWILRKTFF